jgi:purine-binding chemotaxis protein CheW
MKQPTQYVLFSIEGQRHALPLECVERIARMVAVVPVPGAPAAVLGVINVQGRIVPVLDTRRRFGLPQREPQIGDQLVIARAGGRTVALVADAVHGVIDAPREEVVAGAAVLPGLEHFEGMVKLADGMVVIHGLAGLDELATLHIAERPS